MIQPCYLLDEQYVKHLAESQEMGQLIRNVCKLLTFTSRRLNKTTPEPSGSCRLRSEGATGGRVG
ncbi:hypothetical protein FRX31_008875 [Thalictrum thalictroides]|uniref:Uncharacterized protein n=1 Tax=Thalictrum thalictroides TaxID=46969 RepID=A0A7J6WY78_THATH|nr:hypothetical protein FRX31_008875 [Thalictrum thalictroides]